MLVWVRAGGGVPGFLRHLSALDEGEEGEEQQKKKKCCPQSPLCRVAAAPQKSFFFKIRFPSSPHLTRLRVSAVGHDVIMMSQASPAMARGGLWEGLQGEYCFCFDWRM